MENSEQILLLKEIIEQLVKIRYMQTGEISEVETKLKMIIRHLGTEQSRKYFMDKFENATFVINPFGNKDSNEISWHWMLNDFRNLAKELITEIKYWSPQKVKEKENQTKGNINI